MIPTMFTTTTTTTTTAITTCKLVVKRLYERARSVPPTNSMATRSFGSGGGTRGARGHGWWINYRAGKGGRHLQGEYSHLNVDDLKAWNDAVLSLGSQFVYMDIQVEPLHQESSSSSGGGAGGHQSTIADNQLEKHRLVVELASEVLPRATQNFVNLLQAKTDGFKTSTLHRVEKKVGLLGGNVWRGTGKCHEDFRLPTSATAMEHKEKLVLSHIPGVITMLSQRVQEIDSRFLLCTHHAPHMDGKALAIGRLDDESLAKVQEWESTLITQNGHPSTVTLRITDCGILDGTKVEEEVVVSA